MSEHDDNDEMAEAAEMADDIELDADIEVLLADASLWDQPGEGLGERVVAAVRAEAEMGGGVATVAGGREGRVSWMRPALLGAAAAVAILFGGVVMLSALSGSDTGETFSAELTSTGLIADVEGDVEIVEFPSGLRVNLNAPSLPRRDNGKFYEGWLLTFDGNLIPVGTFHGGERVVLWAGVELDAVESFTITLEESSAGMDLGQSSSGEVVLRALVGG